MADTYDLMVVGSGSTASGVALRARDWGWRVAVADCRPLGGTCLLRGCVPKKFLWHRAAAYDAWTRFAGRGAAGDARLDWPALMAAKRALLDPMPEARRRMYADKGIDVFRGTAHFIGPNRLRVDGMSVEAAHVVVATGARPAPLSIDGAGHLATSDAVLELDAPPGRVVLVGGGYIALEFAHILRRAGSQVIILQRADRILPPFDPDLTGWLREATEAAGIAVRTGRTVTAVEKTNDGFRVHTETAAGGVSEAFEADLAVHAAGRVPAVADLDLDAAGVATDDKGRPRLDSHLRSVSNPAVWVGGDAAQQGPPLTPVASHDAAVIADNLRHGPQRRTDYAGTPSVCFALPPIAAVGMAEAEARRQGDTVRVRCERTDDWMEGRSQGNPVRGYKTIVEDGSGRILGAHLLGPEAPEVVNLFALAIRHGLTADDIADALFAYPTGASEIGSML